MKKLLLSTAIVAATSLPVFAQDADGLFRQEMTAQEIHASEFIGMRVYRSDAVDAEEYEGVQEGWDDIGEINDVIFSRDGNVEAVLVDIGGFLGIGENQVAVDMDSIQFVSDSATPDAENDFFLVMNAPADAFENAPVYGAGSDAAADTEEMAEGQAAETEAETAEAGDAMAEEGAEDTEMGATGDDMIEDDAEATDTAMGEEAAEESDLTAEAEAGDEPAEGTDMAATGDAETAPATGAAEMSDGEGMTREGYTTADNSKLTTEDLTGATAYDVNDERVGDIADLVMAEDGKIEAAIVDVGGFLGIGAKSVALELSKLDILRSEDGNDVRVYVTMTEEELEALPEYEN